MNSLCEEIRELFNKMTTDEKKEFLDYLLFGYCDYCFKELAKEEVCYCWNDE